MLADKLSGSSEEQKLKVAVGSDHAGFGLKNEIIEFLADEKIEFTDFGTNSADSTDYPIYAEKVSNAVLSGEYTKGILVCGTGLGISMAANRLKGIRCAVCHDVFSAKATREHNDANVLALGGRVIGAGHALEVVKAFLETEFSGEEKHSRRIRMFD